jgi:Tfp pilus assembly protein PilN
MTDIPSKEELKAKKQKAAIAAMKSARDNMATAITRIEQLEGCIANLAALVDNMMKLIPLEAYPYRDENNYIDKFKKVKADAMRWA